MKNLEPNIRTLERGPLLLMDNGSVVAAFFLNEVRQRMKTATYDLAAMSIKDVYDDVLSLDNDIVPIFLVPKKIADMEIGNLVHFMLKREVYSYDRRSIDFEDMRYLVVAKGKSIDAIDSQYRPLSFGMMCYIPEMFNKLRILGDLAIGMDETGAVKAYRLKDAFWNELENAFPVAAEIAEKIGMERKVEWNKLKFYKELFRML